MASTIPTKMHVSCSDCSLNPICLPTAVEPEDLQRLDNIIERSRPLRKGEHLYRASDPFASVYAVRTGAIKLYSLTEDGDEQVTGFYLPGEILGMDGINTNLHACSAKALETTTVCEIPFNQLEKLSSDIPSLQRHFFQIMSKEIQSDQKLFMLLSKKPAEERVASFLLSLAARHETRGLSGKQFRLPMSRVDMANYLGLVIETVSRTFTKLNDKGLIGVNGKEIEILDRPGLCNAANE